MGCGYGIRGGVVVEIGGAWACSEYNQDMISEMHILAGYVQILVWTKKNISHSGKCIMFYIPL